MRLSILTLCVALSTSFAAQTVAPSVVIIEISKKNEISESSPLEDLFFQGPPDENNPRRNPGALRPVQSEGSGFIVRPDGYIFTNFHVVEGADKIEVKLQDGRNFPARVVGTDEKTDIAVVKIDAKDLPVVQLGDSDAVRVGQFAFAIGAPFKLDYTFTYGVISGKGRSKLFQSGGYSISDYLQTDASINPGNSGGPLCDDPTIRDLFKGTDKGVVVRTIEADAPAAKSDLKPFDVITHVDGTSIDSDSQLQHEILKKKIGQNVQLTVWRKGQTIKVPIKTGE